MLVAFGLLGVTLQGCHGGDSAEMCLGRVLAENLGPGAGKVALSRARVDLGLCDMCFPGWKRRWGEVWAGKRLSRW